MYEKISVPKFGVDPTCSFGASQLRSLITNYISPKSVKLYIIKFLIMVIYENMYEYFRDENSAFEAFKAGLIDLWRETDPKRWQTGYDFPAARDGRIIKKEIKTGIPSGLRGFVFNTRKKSFKDIQVRRALSLVLNFEILFLTTIFLILSR